MFCIQQINISRLCYAAKMFTFSNNLTFSGYVLFLRTSLKCSRGVCQYPWDKLNFLSGLRGNLVEGGSLIRFGICVSGIQFELT